MKKDPAKGTVPEDPAVPVVTAAPEVQAMWVPRQYPVQAALVLLCPVTDEEGENR